MSVAHISPDHVQRHPKRPEKPRDIARTQQLLAKARLCDPEKRERLEKEAAIINMDLARTVAARYWGRGESAEDLVQVAYVGLMKAIRGYDPARGDDFRSYAIPTIAGEVKRHFRDKSWAVRPPRWLQELQAEISAISVTLYQELKRPPRPEDIAERLNIPTDKVREALSADGCFTPATIDGHGPRGDGYAIAQRLGTDDHELDLVEVRIALAPLIQRLPERDRTILALRFFRGWTQSQIASTLGITQMQVSRLLSRILDGLRMELTGG
jgi:RNA polymerase sigma-B factor